MHSDITEGIRLIRCKDSILVSLSNRRSTSYGCGNAIQIGSHPAAFLRHVITVARIIKVFRRRYGAVELCPRTRYCAWHPGGKFREPFSLERPPKRRRSEASQSILKGDGDGFLVEQIPCFYANPCREGAFARDRRGRPAN